MTKTGKDRSFTSNPIIMISKQVLKSGFNRKAESQFADLSSNLQQAVMQSKAHQPSEPVRNLNGSLPVVNTSWGLPTAVPF